MSEEAKKTPEEQAIRAGKGGIVPPVEHQFKPGVSGNPEGRKTAGATIKEHINSMAEAELTEDAIRKIARGKDEPFPRRMAAERILRAMEVGDLADFLPLIKGEKNIDEMRQGGSNTEVVKKLKWGKHGIEIELFDRSGEDFDRVMDRTAGKPNQAVEVSGGVGVTGITMQVVGPKRE